MKKVAATDVRLKHKSTGLFLSVEFLGSRAENDTYTKDSDDASTFKDRKTAIAVAKRLGLRPEEFSVE